MTAPGSTPTRRNTDLRRRNSIEVLDHLRDQGRLSRAELAEHTTLSNQALATILNDLVESGYVVEVETRNPQRGRGRPALLYEYNPHRRSVVSLYVGLRYCEVSLCDGLGRRLATNVEFWPGWDVTRVVAESAARIRALFEQNDTEPDDCHVGVVVHGWIDTRAGTATSTDMGWDTVPLADLLADEVSCDVTVHEASRAAAIAEYREGAATGARRSIVFNVGPDITATQVTDGAIDTGYSGFAGMLGACPVPTGDGGLTTIDALVGSFATKRRYTETTGTHVDWMSDVYDRARAGEQAARDILQLPAEVLAFSAAWLITIGDPERLVLTGAASDYDEPMRAALHSRIVELTDRRLLRGCSIHFSPLGRQAWIRGGVHAALDHQRATDPLAAPG